MSRAPQFWRKTYLAGVPCAVPADDATAEFIRRQKTDSTWAALPEQVRNVGRLRLYWVLCGLVAENRPDLGDKESVDSALRILCGHFEVRVIVLASGEKLILREPRRIAFAKLSEEEFRAYFERALVAIQTELWPGVDIDSLRREAQLESGYSAELSPR